MKQIELELKKRLLVVGLPENCELAGIKTADKVNHTIYYYNERMTKDYYPTAYPLQVKSKFICKGSGLTEDIAKYFFNYEQKFDNFNRFIEGYRLGCALHNTSLSAFISAIKDRNYHWGENPMQIPHPEEFENHFEATEYFDKYREAESRTFNPEKTLIFEIF